MNNKEFTLELARRLDCSTKKATDLMAAVVSEMSVYLEEGDALNIPGFGAFEVKKKSERLSVNPTTKQRMLVPPKLVVTFKPQNALKEKFKKRFLL